MTLTPCEIEVMNILWARGPSTVQEVCDGVERNLSYSTVMTVLRTLYYKRQALTRKKHNRAYIYEPLVQREEVCRELIASLKRNLAGGSVKMLVLNLLDGELISPNDLAEIKSAIERLENRLSVPAVPAPQG